MSFIIRWLVTSVAAAVAIWLIPGFSVVGSSLLGTSVALGLVLALIDISIKPIAQALSIPLSILTLGIFYLIVNTLMLYLAAWIANGIFGAGLVISGFGSAFLASIVISIVASLTSKLVGE